MPHDLPRGLDAQHDANRPHAPERRPSDDVNDPEHYKMSAASKSHGVHGRGGSGENLLDEQAVDTGDDQQLRRSGGRDEPPSPARMRDNSEGRMGGPGWGNEQAGGSAVDRRRDDSNA
jgi:hypothetical protein